ncbi:hypothetical protein C1645_812121 [Glomus cerebriforme]|uniref:DRBM domain-containing protein n=1 Tax=Glomus cerebriforme TaxID=658196 RepID=A0A397TLT8_9GLOM|nr:hypothetical protein C1645_812121 [Glomus cerebriforme]
MYGLPPAPYPINYTGSNSFSNLSAKNNIASNINNGLSYLPINNNVFKAIGCINSNSSNLLAINNVTSNNNSHSNIPVNNNIFKANSCINNGNPSNNIISSSDGISSNLSVNNNIFNPISCINSSTSPNLPVLEEKSSNIPATEVLEEMYNTLKLDIPPVFTFRQEIVTQKFFCSAGFMNKWYDTKEAFPNQEGAKEAAAQNLLKIIMASEEYENYLRVQEEKQSTSHQTNVGGLSMFLKNLHINPATPETMRKKRKRYRGRNRINVGNFNQNINNGNKQFITQGTAIQKLSKKQRKKLHRQLMMQKDIEKQNAVQDNLCPVPVSIQECKPKKVTFDDKILILGEDVIPKSKSSMGLKSIMSQKNQSSSNQYNEIPGEPETYQTLVSEKDKICIPPSKLLDEFCIISNFSKPMYNFCNGGYGNYYIAEILVGGVKYIGEQVFWYPDEAAHECVAEMAFNILYAKSDENTKRKLKERISLALLDRFSIDMQIMPNEAAASFILPQQRYEQPNFAETFPKYNDPCMQRFGIPPSQLPASYCNVQEGPSPQLMFNNSSTFGASLFPKPSVQNLGSVQQTHQEISTQIQTNPKSSTVSSTLPQQHQEVSTQIQTKPKSSTVSSTLPQHHPNEFPCILYKLVNEKGWGIIDYEYSKTLKGYKCSCYVRKLKFTSNTCVDKESARNQAAKIALLALPEYKDCEI